MTLSVSDSRSNPKDQIEHAVEVLGHAKQRIAVFNAIYRGKKRIKTVNEIAQATGLKRIRVLQEAKFLADNLIIKPIPIAGLLAYEKDPFYSAQKKKILRYVQDPVAFSSMPTKTRPQIAGQRNATIQIPKVRIRARLITIDDIDSFGRVARIHSEPENYLKMQESRFKNGIARILGEGGRFKDWGGERNDLYTTRVRISGRCMPTAFAFKGKGTRGILTPKKMGKNGDQIQRLFKTPASVFIVQYWGQVHESIVEQMAEFAKAKSAIEGSLVLYGIMDGDDSYRLLEAYPRAFR
jgi:hypothetical protein